MSANTIQHIRGNHPEAPTDRRPSTTSFHRSGHLIFNTTWLWVSLCETTLKHLWDNFETTLRQFLDKDLIPLVQSPHLQHNLTLRQLIWCTFLSFNLRLKHNANLQIVGVLPLIGVNEIREASETGAVEVSDWCRTTAFQDIYHIAPFVKFFSWFFFPKIWLISESKVFLT